MDSLLNERRLDCIIIWGHGLSYSDDILNMIRDVDDFEITRIIKYKPKKLKRFVNEVYSYDYAPIEHLKSKIKYLNNVKPEVLCIVINNTKPFVDIIGKGSFRHEESLKLKELKTNIRKRFNPYNNGEMTHEHVIHATDNAEQTFHILNAIGENSIDISEKKRLFLIPDFLGKPKRYIIKEIDYSDLFCSQITINNSQLSTEVVTIKESVQYKALIGDTTAYTNYITKYLGTGLKCDYTLDKLLSLSEFFSYRAEGYKNSFVVVRQHDINSYLIVDGLHRAAIHYFQGNKKIKVCVIQ